MRKTINKILVSRAEAQEILSIGRSKLLELAYSGEIPSLKIGSRRLFETEALYAWARSKSMAPSSRQDMEEFFTDLESSLQENRG